MDSAPGRGYPQYIPTFTWYTLIFLAIICFGTLDLYAPFDIDQAVFIMGAKTIGSGHMLYSDYWDPKQPAIFVFFLFAGYLFGYSEAGIHIFELLWMLVFTAILCYGLRDYYHHKWLSGLAPLAILTTYFGYRNFWNATQVEIVVMLPFAASIILLCAGNAPYRALLSGVFAGIACAFKLLFAPIFVLFLAIASINRIKTFDVHTIWSTTYRLWVPYALGVLFVLVGICGWFYAKDALPELLWTSFVYPVSVMREIKAGLIPAAPATRLLKSLLQHLLIVAPWLLFTLIPLPLRSLKKEGLVTRMMIAWLIGGAVVIYLQRYSGWYYQMQFLLAPMIVLAVRGIDLLVVRLAPPGRDMKPALLAAILAFPAMAAMAYPAEKKLVDFNAALRNSAGPIEYERQQIPGYQQYEPLISYLQRPEALKGPIYVFGNPIIYYLSGREQNIPFGGCCYKFHLTSQYHDLTAMIIQRKPVYIWINDAYRRTIQSKSPYVLEAIEKFYQLDGIFPKGKLYRIRENAEAGE